MAEGMIRGGCSHGHDDDRIFRRGPPPRDRVALLLKEFSRLSDEREQQRVLYPLEEVLLLVTCATDRLLRRL